MGEAVQMPSLLAKQPNLYLKTRSRQFLVSANYQSYEYVSIFNQNLFIILTPGKSVSYQ
jgi:hypothetical protein